MSPLIPSPPSGINPADVAARLRAHGSGYVDGNGLGFPGPPGSPGVHVGPTPPTDTTLLWVDTNI